MCPNFPNFFCSWVLIMLKWCQFSQQTVDKLQIFHLGLMTIILFWWNKFIYLIFDEINFQLESFPLLPELARLSIEAWNMDEALNRVLVPVFLGHFSFCSSFLRPPMQSLMDGFSQFAMVIYIYIIPFLLQHPYILEYKYNFGRLVG